MSWPVTPREDSSKVRQSRRRFHQRVINEDLHQDARLFERRGRPTHSATRGLRRAAPPTPGEPDTCRHVAAAQRVASV